MHLLLQMLSWQLNWRLELLFCLRGRPDWIVLTTTSEGQVFRLAIVIWNTLILNFKMEYLNLKGTCKFFCSHTQAHSWIENTCQWRMEPIVVKSKHVGHVGHCFPQDLWLLRKQEAWSLSDVILFPERACESESTPCIWRVLCLLYPVPVCTCNWQNHQYMVFFSAFPE